MSDTEEKTTDVDKSTGDKVGIPGNADEAMQLFRDHVSTLTAVEDVDVQAKVLQAVLAATTAEDILRAGEALPAEQLLNIPIRVEGIRASESGFVDGADYYLHVDATIIGNGDKVTFSTGSSDVVMKLVAFSMRGLFPVDCRIERAAKATANGFFPLFLRALDGDQKPF